MEPPACIKIRIHLYILYGGYFCHILGLFRGTMLGYNLVILGLIFDCILPLVPFSFKFNGEMVVLTYSWFEGANFVLL